MLLFFFYKHFVSYFRLSINLSYKYVRLPDVSALTVPGVRDGQTLMVKENGKAVAYNWSQIEQTWVKIGDIVGTSGGSATKQLYNGKEYDYVFSVDIQDGVPPLKLPYNKTEDPWHVAQNFIYQHGLSQMFLDQVMNKSLIIALSN